MFELSVPAPSAEDAGALAGALSWVSPRFGPIRRLELTTYESPEPRWSVYAAELSRVPAGSYDPATATFAAGASLAPREALRRVLGESVERYSAGHVPDPRRLFRATRSDSALASRFPRCASDEHCPPTFCGIGHAESPLAFTRVRQLCDGAEVEVPAAYVYQEYEGCLEELPIAFGISTGLAFQLDTLRAVWSGLCEVAERDALMLTWWARRPAPRLDLRDVPEPLADRVLRLAEAGVSVSLFDISTDFRVPTVFCALFSDRYPRVTTGAGCTADPLAACTKAIDEAIGVRHFLRQTKPASVSVDAKTFHDVRTLADHSLFYASSGGSPAFDFLLQGEAPARTFRDFAADPWWGAPARWTDLAERARELAQLGLTVLWTDVTVPEAAKLGRVVKVVVPEMLPLSPDDRARWLATPRLIRFAAQLGCGEWNPFPHPFA